MILIFGSTGYIGSALAAECGRRGIPWAAGSRTLERNQFHGCSHVFNASAFIPTPSVEACKDHPQETIAGNILWPNILTQACQLTRVPLTHLSTGCMWNDGLEHGEEDELQRSFTGPCGFYVGTKVMAENLVRAYDRHYILRIRLPFDEFDHPRNYLTKLASFKEVYDHTNSLTHRGDFVKAALDLVEMGAPYGTYNCTNPGSVSATSILAEMFNQEIPTMSPVHIVDGPATDCKLNVQKLLSTGVKMRDVSEALGDALRNWKPAKN